MLVRLDETLEEARESEEDGRFDLTVEKGELLVTKSDLDLSFGISRMTFQSYHQYDSFSSCTKQISSVFWPKLKVLCPIYTSHFSNRTSA